MFGHLSVGGIVVSIAAFQAVDPGSIPGQRNCFLLFTPLAFSYTSFLLFEIARKILFPFYLLKNVLSVSFFNLSAIRRKQDLKITVLKSRLQKNTLLKKTQESKLCTAGKSDQYLRNT